MVWARALPTALQEFVAFFLGGVAILLVVRSCITINEARAVWNDPSKWSEAEMYSQEFLTVLMRNGCMSFADLVCLPCALHRMYTTGECSGTPKTQGNALDSPQQHASQSAQMGQYQQHPGPQLAQYQQYPGPPGAAPFVPTEALKWRSISSI